MSCWGPSHPSDLTWFVQGQGKEAGSQDHTRVWCKVIGREGEILPAVSASCVHRRASLPARKNTDSHRDTDFPSLADRMRQYSPVSWTWILNNDAINPGNRRAVFTSCGRTMTICATLCAAICMSHWIAFFFFPFHWFLEWEKKPTHVGKRNWTIKKLHMFLILKMFSFNCPRGSKWIAFLHTRHMTKGDERVWGISRRAKAVAGGVGRMRADPVGLCASCDPSFRPSCVLLRSGMSCSRTKDRINTYIYARRPAVLEAQWRAINCLFSLTLFSPSALFSAPLHDFRYTSLPLLVWGNRLMWD